MSAPLSDDIREIVPRWRDLKSTIQLGELRPLQSDRQVISLPTALLEDKLVDWETERSLPYAAEVVGAAFVSGEFKKAKAMDVWAIGAKGVGGLFVTSWLSTLPSVSSAPQRCACEHPQRASAVASSRPGRRWHGHHP